MRRGRAPDYAPIWTHRPIPMVSTKDHNREIPLYIIYILIIPRPHIACGRDVVLVGDDLVHFCNNSCAKSTNGKLTFQSLLLCLWNASVLEKERWKQCHFDISVVGLTVKCACAVTFQQGLFAVSLCCLLPFVSYSSTSRQARDTHDSRFIIIIIIIILFGQ